MNNHISKILTPPNGMIDVVLDTDAFNEIDDQFAISYLLAYTERLNLKAIYAAPFKNEKVKTEAEGMQKSYDEIHKLLILSKKSARVFRGSEKFLVDELTPTLSPAAEDLIKLATDYSPENPLYVIAIGAITNIASALLLRPEIGRNIVVVWLGGHSHSNPNTAEFNMRQDIAAARVVMKLSENFIQLPCDGVVSDFKISGPELKAWLYDKNPTADYLARNTVKEVSNYCSSEIWTRVIWDVTAVAWLLNDGEHFMHTKITDLRLPGYDNLYSDENCNKKIGYVYTIERDNLMRDLIEKLCTL